MNMHEGNTRGHEAVSSEKHKQIQAQIAEADIRSALAEARKSADAGEIGKAQIQHSLAYSAFVEHKNRGELSPEAERAFDAELHDLFERIELDEAA